MKRAWVAALPLLFVGCGQTAEVKKDADEQAAVVQEPPPPPPKITVIPAGTRISVRTSSTISSETVRPGELFTGTLEQPVMVEGAVAIPKGSTVQGAIMSVDDGGRVKGLAKVSLRVTQIQAGGKLVPVRSSLFTRTAPATKKKDAVKVGIGAGIGAAIGAIAGGGKGAAIGAASGAGAGTAVVLATHGEPAVIGAESVIGFRLTGELTISE